MAAITTTRGARASELEQLRGELAEVRAEVAELRAALKATGQLALGIGRHRAPASAGSRTLATVRDICGLYGVGPTQAAAIDALFSS